MSARPIYRRFVVVGIALASLANSGCNPLTALYFLFLLPPPKLPAACEALEHETVVVLAYAGRGARFEYAGIDNELAKGVVRELRENVSGIKLADPNEVRQWRDEHDDFELTDVGKAFKATRVLYLEIEEFTLYEANSAQLFRGSAKLRMQVADMEKDGEIVWETPFELQYPGQRPIATSEISRERFRAVFVKHLTRQVAHHFFEYRPDEDFTVN
jgi:hypothetical protein